MKIAVSGKGGTGKTTIAALIVRYLLERKLKPVLAVDADPNANLGDALGVSVENTVGRVLDRFLKEKENVPMGVVKEAMIDQKLSEILVEERGFDLISMGQGEGPGCYCYPNSIVRNYIERLAANYRYVVIDNEAGMEHISRRTNGSLDVLLLVSDPSLRGIRTCKKLEDLVHKLGLQVNRLYLVLNRITDTTPPQLFQEAQRLNLNLLGVMPEDGNIGECEISGNSILKLAADSPAVVKLDEMMKKVFS